MSNEFNMTNLQKLFQEKGVGELKKQNSEHNEIKDIKDTSLFNA
jgi:hypothetical protein